MVVGAFVWIALGLVLTACHQSVDPCPRGLRVSRDLDHCVPGARVDSATEPVEESSSEGSDGPDANEPDRLDADPAGLQVDAGESQDVETSASAMDAVVPVGAEAAAGPTDNDAQLADGGPSLPPDAEGSEASTPSADAGMCSRSDLDAWRGAHLRNDIRDRVTQCRVDCDNDVACADLCMRRSAGMAGCNQCTRAEAECSARFCNYACLASRTDQMCLSCLCQSDCISAFESCAGTELALCTVELFTFGPSAGGGPLDAAALLLGKSTTGALAITKFDATTQQLADDLTAINHFPSGAAQLVPVSFAERDLVLHYTASCNATPCTVRGYPVLRDGSFAAPVFEERWEAGFVDIEAFSLAGARYLVRMRDQGGGTTASENLFIDRLDWNHEQQRLQSAPILRTRVVPPRSQGYRQVEPFSLGGDTFLFLLAPETGDAVILRVRSTSVGLELTPASDAISWSPGWDLVEGFKSLGRWYLLVSKSGRVATDQEPAGQARIWQPRLSPQGSVGLDVPVLDEQWSAGITQVLSFTDASGRARVLLNLEALGRLRIHELEGESARWHEDFLVPHQEQFRGRVPPWDLLGVVRDGKW